MAVAAAVTGGVVAGLLFAGTTTALVLTIKQRKKLKAEFQKRASKAAVEKKFKREHFIGSGGFGDVYAWKHREYGLLLAAKEARGGNIKNKDMLLDEAKKLADLEHVNVVAFFTLFIDPDHDKAYLFMELMATSVGKLARQNPISEINARACIRNVMDGLIYIHSKSVIHCDIKGDNVLIDGKGTAKLADFGISKYYSNSSAALTVHFAGSLPFMSPELLTGKTHGKRSDLWAVGCTVMEMLNQRPPFHDEIFPIAMENIKSMKVKDVVENMEASHTKKFLLSIFVDFDERPYPEDLRSHEWLMTEAET